MQDHADVGFADPEVGGEEQGVAATGAPWWRRHWLPLTAFLVGVLVAIASIAPWTVPVSRSRANAEQARGFYDDLVSTRSDLDAARADIERLTGERDDLESERNGLVADLEEARDRQADDGDTIEALTADVEGLTRDVQRAQDRADEAEETALAALDDDRQALLDEDAARDAELDAREEELRQRENAVSAVEQSSFRDGTFIVGDDIPAGQYRSDGIGSSCYWERTTSDGERIINNHFGPSPAVATVRAGELFSTRGCGTWRPT